MLIFYLITKLTLIADIARASEIDGEYEINCDFLNIQRINSIEYGWGITQFFKDSNVIPTLMISKTGMI